LLTTNLLRGNYQFVAVAWNDGLEQHLPGGQHNCLPQPPGRDHHRSQSIYGVFSLGEPIVIQAIASDVDGVADQRPVPGRQFCSGNDTNAPYSIVGPGRSSLS